MTRSRFYIAVLLVAAVALTARYLVPVRAYFSDTETVRGDISAGTWETGPPVKICGVCPCWGLAGACRWPVFIYGEGFKGEATAKLVKGQVTLVASKTWVLNGFTAYAVFDLRSAGEGLYDVRLDFADGRSGVLGGAFRVLSCGACGYAAASMDSTGPAVYAYEANGVAGKGAYDERGEWLEEGASLEKGAEPGNRGSLALVARKGLKREVARAYAVAPGVLLEGRVMRGKGRQVAVVFDLRGAPQRDYDVVLLDPGDWPLLLEGMITPADVRAVEVPRSSLPWLPAAPLEGGGEAETGGVTPSPGRETPPAVEEPLPDVVEPPAVQEPPPANGSEPSVEGEPAIKAMREGETGL
ncbi:MAG: hypothetical protein H5T73_12620 [Actinobacteria bacterium]|nr:hypothetical protein [Actinomycetota bacterium]